MWCDCVLHVNSNGKTRVVKKKKTSATENRTNSFKQKVKEKLPKMLKMWEKMRVNCHKNPNQPILSSSSNDCGERLVHLRTWSTTMPLFQSLPEKMRSQRSESLTDLFMRLRCRETKLGIAVRTGITRTGFSTTKCTHTHTHTHEHYSSQLCFCIC